MSKEGIFVDPLKVEAILNLPPPSNLCQLQSLQGKTNLLRQFILNYAKLTKGFTQLLKKGFSLVWDETSKKYSNILRHALNNTPLLHPLDYNRDYFLYLSTSSVTIFMVLI